MKKLLSILLTAALAAALCSCAAEKPAETTAPPTEATTQLVTQAETKPTTAVTETETAPAPDENGYYTEGKFLRYSKDGYHSEIGIDVSAYSGDIDWKKVAKSGVTFAMIRLGGRGYGDEGALYPDEKAAYNLAEAINNGIKVGGYFFSQATTAHEALLEADYCLGIIGRTKLYLPIAYDFEHIEGDTARTDDISKKQAATFAKSFCSWLERAGVDSAVYYDASKDNFDPEDLGGRTLWVADYENHIERTDDTLLYQYSKEGKLAGISGAVDLNIMYVKDE